MRSVRRRIPVSVADISEARCTWLGWRYLSITATRVPSSSDAAVQNVNCALAFGAMRRRTARAHTGSSPVSSTVSEVSVPSGEAAGVTGVAGRASNDASGRQAARLRPCQR